MNNVVEIQRLTRKFGEKVALDNTSLTLEQGGVLGLIGENGAGKTTLIKHILGLLKAQQGSVRVFGLDPVADPVNVLSNIGYLAEEDWLPNWMKVHELQRYCRGCYATWDQTYADELCTRFSIDKGARLKELSKGQRARVGLMAALAYRPQLLVLDEPSSGLDPIVRREILSSIIHAVASENRSVLFSSHLLAEIEQVADRVAMIRNGKMVFCDSVETVKSSHVRATLKFKKEPCGTPKIEDAFDWGGSGDEWNCMFAGTARQLQASATVAGAEVVEWYGLSLDEIFVARSGASGE